VFGVFADPRAYGALLYMLLSLVTGIFYFTWAVTGLSLTLGLAVLIIGIPFAILFFASVRGLALLEGRLVEVMLGERMPRRPAYADREQAVAQAHRRHVLRPAHLVDAVLPAADAAAGRPLLHAGGPPR
jgi:hypothetical protein